MALRIVIVLLAGMWFASDAHAQALDEYQVKAAFLYNFAKFVEWPAEAFRTSHDPVNLCVLGRNPFGDTLEEVIRGKLIEGRSLAYRQIPDVASAGVCQILFVPSSESKYFHAMQANLRAPGVLTVGETQGFAAAGGVINFKLADGRVRFEINVEAAEHARIRISSKLLSLAEIVKMEKFR